MSLYAPAIAVCTASGPQALLKSHPLQLNLNTL